MIQAIREYFLLTNALRVAESVPEEKRSRVADLLRLSRQRGEAGEALWTAGHTAEGLKLAVQALEEGVRAVEAYAPPSREAAEGEEAPSTESATPEEIKAALVGRGVPEPRAKALGAVLKDLHAKPRPKFDAEVSRADEDLFQEVVGGRELIDQALRLAAQTKPEIRRLRGGRFTALGVAGLVLAAGIAWKMRPSDGVHVAASATWGDAADHQPDAANDGITSTCWLLPDRSPGWLELRFDSARHVNQVRIHNAHNEPWNDRGTQGYRIELYSGNDLVRGIDGEFAWEQNDWVSHEAAADNVDRVRLVVNSYFHAGGAVAELEVQ